ncbi:hypothetical protein CBR_g57022 [Chara braunii]|uniref:RNA-directed DNA polymerase n=1 Tax=Chara braunii TaxID=69332 RepID=A0A388K7W2_CHABU|nr:hypothetical protein CBR_g57022 [Chara braunii]|eukprot:GBG66140.1 hypothetical protein CBR_g57022 [Chara braunii]
MEFVHGLQRQRIAAAQRQQAAMAAGGPMIRPAVAGAVLPLRCYNCNQPGHLAKDCPKPRTQSGSAGPTGPSQIPLAAPTAAGQERVAMVMDTGTTEMVTPAATEIGPDEYMAATMFEPRTIGVIRHVQRITEESDLGPWRPGFEDLAASGPEYKDGHIDVLDAVKALDLRIPIPIPYLLTISEAANEKLIERCLKNRRRFEESQKGKKSVLRDPPTNEESQPSTSKVHEANRIGMIQTVDSASKPEVFLRAYPITWKSVECDCEVWGNPSAAILNLGSSVVAISWRLTERLGREEQVQPLRPDELYISATEDNINCKGRITNVPIRVGRVHCLCDAIVLDVQAYDVLLGIPWQAAVGARMHFDSWFKVALEKSEFFLSKISFWGYIVTDEGLEPDPRKVAAVREAPAPVTLTQVRAFLGLASYYRRFIRSFACLAKPLTNLLKKEEQLIWTPVLARPDPTRQFALHTDGQPQAISAVLTQQGSDGREHVIEYASKTLSQAQSNYEACKGECLAVVWGVQHFRPYLYGQKFVLVTDHQPLLSLWNNTDYTGTLGRWAVRLQDNDFDIRHRATRQHGNADGLTRLQPPSKSPANEKHIPWKPISPSTEPGYGEVNVLRKGVYVDMTQLPGRETTRVFIEFRALQVAPNFVHSVATFIGDLTILPPPSWELARSFVREYVVQAARSVARMIDPGLLELIHLELLSIAQVIASKEEEIQPRLRTTAAPRRTYNAVVISDYIAQRAERLEDFPEEKPLRPPSSNPRPAPPKAPKKMPKRKRRHPSPGAQGSRIGGGEEVVQPVHTRDLDPVPGSAATRVKETIVPSPPFPRVPDLNLDGAGPSTAAAGGGSRVGLLDPVPGSPVLAGPFRFRPPPLTAPIIDISSYSEPDGPSDRGGLHGGAHHHQTRGHRGGAAP